MLEHGQPQPLTYLSPATLVSVVPQNLLGQWENEINKHCTMQIPQRVLVIRKEIKIPSPKQLASDYIVRSKLKLPKSRQMPGGLAFTKEEGQLESEPPTSLIRSIEPTMAVNEWLFRSTMAQLTTAKDSRASNGAILTGSSGEGHGRGVSPYDKVQCMGCT